jgi:hypothetical protein
VQGAKDAGYATDAAHNIAARKIQNLHPRYQQIDTPDPIKTITDRLQRRFDSGEY